MYGFTLTTKKDRTPKIVKVNLTRVHQATGYSKSHLSRVFARKTAPSVSCAVAIAEALDMTVDNLLLRLRSKRSKFNVSRAGGQLNGVQDHSLGHKRALSPSLVPDDPANGETSGAGDCREEIPVPDEG